MQRKAIAVFVFGSKYLLAGIRTKAASSVDDSPTYETDAFCRKIAKGVDVAPLQIGMRNSQGKY